MEVAGSTVWKQRCCETQVTDWIIEVSYLLLLALHVLFLEVVFIIRAYVHCWSWEKKVSFRHVSKVELEHYFLLSYIRYITSFHWEDLIFWNLLKNLRSVFPVLCTRHVDAEELIQGK